MYLNGKLIDLSDEEREKARQIIGAVSGMTICSASELLDKCRDLLLTTKVESNMDKSDTEAAIKKTAGNQGTTVNHFIINISGNSGAQRTAPSSHAGNRSGWHGKFYTNNPVEMAYRIILLLEETKVPRMCVDSILEAVKSILDFQEVVITPRNLENPNFPK